MRKVVYDTVTGSDATLDNAHVAEANDDTNMIVIENPDQSKAQRQALAEKRMGEAPRRSIPVEGSLSVASISSTG